MNRSMPFVILALLSVLSMPASRAQTIDGAAYATPITDNVQPMLYGNLFSKSYIDRAKSDHAKHARSDKRAADPSSDAEFAVHFDPRVSREVREDYIAEVERLSGAKAARGLDDYYTANDVHALLRTAVAPYGLRTDDLGDVTTAWLVVMWMTANQASLPALDVVRGVRTQTRAALLDAGRVPAGAEERQRVLETLAYQTVTLISVRESTQASGNQAYLAELADSAQASMRRQDFDLRAMALTRTGMVRR